MGVLTSSGENYMIDAFLAKVLADEKTLYAQLATTLPTKSSAGTAAAGVSRVAVTLERVNDTMVNSDDVDFGLGTVIETMVGVDIFDDPTAGTRYMGGPLASELYVVVDQPVKILAGGFVYSPEANA